MPHARHRVSREEYDLLLEHTADYNLLYDGASYELDYIRKEIDNERKMRHDLYYVHGENCKKNVIDMQATIIRLKRHINELKACGDGNDGGTARKCKPRGDLKKK